MNDLKRSLSEAAAAAFQAAGLPPEFGRVTASDRPDLADFQCNGALAAAKSAKRNPREIAAQVVETLKGDPRLALADATASLSLLLDHVRGLEGRSVADPYFGEDAGFTETWREVSLAAEALVRELAS